MERKRSLPRGGKNPGRSVVAILVAILLACQIILPSAVFARSPEQTSTSSFSLLPYIQDKVGVSVVRLVATYGAPSAGNTSTANTPIKCTSLGVLVASKQLSSAIYQNWVLTDGNVVGTQLSQCGMAGGTVSLSALHILASTTYNSTDHVLGDLACSTLQSNLVCDDTSGISAAEKVLTFPLLIANSQSFYTLLSFRSTAGEPYLTSPPTTTTSLGTDMTEVRLTNGSQAQFFPGPAVDGRDGQLQMYLTPKAEASSAAGAGSVSSPIGSTPTDEGGTPIVNNKGQLVGIVVSNGKGVFAPLATPTTMATILAQPPLPAPASPVANPQACTDGSHVAPCWNAGIDAFYGAPPLSAPDTTTARSYLAAFSTHNLNPQFIAPQSFEQRLPAAQPVVPPAPSPTAPSWLWLAGWLAIVPIVILLLVLLLVLMSYSRRRRRGLARFAAEQLEAQRIAEAEVQRQRAQKAQLEAHYPQTQQAQAAAPEVACPNCHQPVHLTDTMCPHCRFPLSPTDSGLNMRLAGSAPLPPSASFMSEQPTIEFPPHSSGDVSAMNNNYQPSIAEAETVHNLQPSIAEAETVPNFRPPHDPNLSLAVGTVSDPGLKRKQKPNEDSLFAMQGARTHNSQPQQFGLFVVADGMGGHANGQDASRQAIQAMIDFMLPRVASSEPMDDDAFLKLMHDGVQSANQAVFNRNMQAHADMGTTMTTALVAGSTAYVANVGDSRTYLYREGYGLSKVTNDHSVVASLVEAGIIQPDDIYTHPKRNQIYRSLGEKQQVEVDTFKVDLQPGDKLLLCSDGLWDMVRDPLIQQVLSKPTGDPNYTGQELIKAALDGGGEDNVSVIVAQFSPVQAPTGQTGVHLLAKPETVTVPDLPPMT